MSKPESVGREILYERVDDHVALVTLNRPEKRNAINADVALAMRYIVHETEADDAIRVVVLASCLDTTFCAGADLGELAAGRGHLLFPEGAGFGGLVDAPRCKPWIAAVRGNALAGGCELALACDLIVASPDARFGLPEVKRGLFAGAGGVHRLPRALPRNVALELVMTGNSLGAERAYALGLINRLVPSDAVIAEARQLAGEIATNAPISVREALRVARLANELSDAELRQISATTTTYVHQTEDAMEGPRAFLEKRPAVWKGR
ncbi:MAG: enoyl-CoA hydratase [Sphingomonadales bacterium]|nr:enoyl-CoA hydratase [Sphingomonadales bacterium]